MNRSTYFFDSENRLRSGWRFVIFCIAFIGFGMLVGSLGVGLLTASGLSLEPGSVGFVLANLFFPLFPALLVGWICGKFLEGLPFRALGAWFSEGWLRHLILGIVTGSVTLSLAVLIAFVFGGLSFTTNPVNGMVLLQSLGISFAVFAVGAAGEEALFRGYILQTFHRSGLAWVGIALTSAFFGIVHGANPNADVISTINTMLAGVWFGLAYLKTRDLWFVFGIHLMWNWMQNAFFGIEVSGLTTLTPEPLLREIDSGPAWLTGASYGVEGGIVTTIALVVSMVVIWFLPGLKPGTKSYSS